MGSEMCIRDRDLLLLIEFIFFSRLKARLARYPKKPNKRITSKKEKREETSLAIIFSGLSFRVWSLSGKLLDPWWEAEEDAAVEDDRTSITPLVDFPERKSSFSRFLTNLLLLLQVSAEF